MTEYISREAAYNAIVNNYTIDDQLQDLCSIPAADVAEVRHGRWIKMDMHKGMEQYKCSVCRSECYVPECMGEPMYEYCPSCGAKMDESEDEE